MLGRPVLDGGVSGLFVLGSSAEVPYMTTAERNLVVSTIAEANAAVGFRNGGAKEAHLAQALPEPGVMGLLALEHGAHGGRRTAVREETPRLVAQLLLVV